jgi:hypothetical protein
MAWRLHHFQPVLRWPPLPSGPERQLDQKAGKVGVDMSTRSTLTRRGLIASAAAVGAASVLPLRASQAQGN